MNYFVISDIHGNIDKFNKVLQHFDPSKHQLVLLGDYIDRGDESLEVLQMVKELKEQHPSTMVLYGNHEELFLSYMDEQMEYQKLVSYMEHDGGRNTIDSLTEIWLSFNDEQKLKQRLAEARQKILEDHSDLITFLKTELLYYYKVGDVLFTHAGYDTTKTDWEDTDDSTFLTIRRHYLAKPHDHIINVFGHTPTNSIRKHLGDGESNNYYIIKERYIAIDGNCGKGGQLNAIVLDTNGKILEEFKA